MKRKFLTALLAIFSAICLTLVSACDLLGNSSGTNSGGDEQSTEQTGGNTSGNTFDDGSTSGGGNTDGGSTEHTHALVKTEAKEATCTSEGNIEYWSCTGCGKYFADSAAETEITMDDIVLFVSHTYSGSWTCTLCGNQLTESEGLKYTLSDSGNSYIISGIGSCTDTDIVIPYTYSGLPVTGIKNQAFYPCSAITSIYIPDSVTYIGNSAFHSCYSLTSVYTGNGVTYIGSEAFESCISLNHIKMGDSLTSIGSCAFGLCTSLINIIIPKNVTDLKYMPFSGCTLLNNISVDSENTTYKSIDGILYSYDGTELVSYALGKPETTFTIPDGVTSINAGAFANCGSDEGSIGELIDSNLREVIIPESITSIGYGAFYSCSSLESVTIPKSVTSIDHDAFAFCVMLNNIIIPDSVTSIGEDAFIYCYSLISATVGSGVLSIDDYAFFECTKLIEICNLSSLNIIKGSENNGSIGYYAKNIYTASSGQSKLINQNDYVFYNNNGTYYLMGYVGAETDIVLPETINGNTYSLYTYNDIYGKYTVTFCFNSKITSIVLPDSLTSISNGAFMRCISLESVTIPDTLIDSLGSEAFYYCTSLKDINISITDMSAICDNTIYYLLTELKVNPYDDYCLLDTMVINRLINDKFAYFKISNYIYDYDVTDEDDIISLYSNIYPNIIDLYQNGELITELTIPSSVTAIGDHAFCFTSLTSVKIPDSVTTIGDYAFYFTSLTSITIPNSVTSIGNSAFEYCASLTSVEISDSVTSIGDYTFSYCTSLKNIEVSSNNNNYETIDGNLYSYDGKTLIQYATGKTETTFTIPDGVTTIEMGAFAGNTSLKNVTIPNSVTTIGDYAFDFCSSLTNVTIPDSVTSIGDYAFAGNTSLTSITIPNSVTSIGIYAFYMCTSLKSVTIPDSVTSIGGFAFASNTSLISITIPNSVTSIGGLAFNGCTSLTSITIPDSVTYIGYAAFSDCKSLTNVTFENTSGWYVTITYGATSGETIPSNELSRASIAAEYLTNDYRFYCWYRSEN